jgi:hypothetical protein
MTRHKHRNNAVLMVKIHRNRGDQSVRAAKPDTLEVVDLQLDLSTLEIS